MVGMQSDVPQSPIQNNGNVEFYRRSSKLDLQQEKESQKKLKKANQCIQRLQSLLSHTQDELQEQLMELERLR